MGYAASFGRHYAAAEDFRAFLCASLGKDNPYGVSLRIDGGRLSAQYDGERNCINTFDSPDAGYRLVVDTRPKETTYDDFTVVCRDPDGQTVSYDAYKAMDDARRERYECRMEYSGTALDVSRGMADYEAFLGAVCDVNAAQYDRDVAENMPPCNATGATVKKADAILRTGYTSYTSPRNTPTLSGRMPMARRRLCVPTIWSWKTAHPTGNTFFFSMTSPCVPSGPIPGSLWTSPVMCRSSTTAPSPRTK